MTTRRAPGLRVIVCGGRDYADRERVFAELDRLQRERGRFEFIMSGAARGADTLAREWAIEHGIQWQGAYANWSKFGRAAGPIRNAGMLKNAQPHFVVAFPGGDGTKDMVTKARAAGVEVIEIADVE